MISSEQYRFSPVYLPPSFKSHSNHWAIKSWKAKNNRLVDLYSQLEYFNFVLLEANPNVRQLCEQPLHINCNFKGVRLNYVFDLWVRWKDGEEELIEVKPDEKLIPNLDGQREPKKWELVKAWCNENGYKCRFVTDKDILSNRIFLSNARQILRYSPTYLDLSLRDELLTKVPKGVSVSLREVMKLYPHVPSECFMSTLVFALINGNLSSDLESFPFSPETRILGN